MDHEGMNELLTKNRLAKGASILISEGKLAIPYDDGELPNKDQQVASIKENIIEFREKADLIIHSNKVLKKQIERINLEVSSLDKDLLTPGSKESYDKGKEVKERVKILENQRDQTLDQISQNEAELSRLETNIEVFNETLLDLTSA